MPCVSTRGFKSIVDGKTLAGWEGNPTYWRVEDRTLLGEITPATVIKSNTFIVWRGGGPKDFELKLEYRITPDGNSGFNYRSSIVPDAVLHTVACCPTALTAVAVAEAVTLSQRPVFADFRIASVT